MSFDDEWNKETESAIKAQQEIVKTIAIELFSGIVTSSPVGNPDLWKSPPEPGYTGGSFRSNWFLTKNSPSSRYSESRNTSGNAIITSISATIKSNDSESWTLSNNAPYAKRLENGWSTQAPIGIVAPNVSRVESLIPRIEKTVNRRYGVD